MEQYITLIFLPEDLGKLDCVQISFKYTEFVDKMDSVFLARRFYETYKIKPIGAVIRTNNVKEYVYFNGEIIKNDIDRKNWKTKKLIRFSSNLCIPFYPENTNIQVNF